jgi:hypothetical protein
VSLKEEKKERFINLRFKESYSVQYEEGDYYFIMGDDYKSHRYKKSNFNVVKV